MQSCSTHIYEFSSFTSGSRKSGNSAQSYWKNSSKDKKPHDFGSIQSAGKRLLHGTNRWGNLGSFLAIAFHDSPLRTQKSPPFQRKKIEIEKLKKRKNGVKSRNKRTRH